MNDECTCLSSEDTSLPHAARCDAVRYGDQHKFSPVDHDDIRELAEIAANSDIDTALTILRAHRARTAH